MRSAREPLSRAPWARRIARSFNTETVLVITAPGRIRKRVLNAGSGANSPRRLHPVFDPAEWDEIRLDIDPHTRPDIVGSVVDMRLEVPSQSFDAVWCSHILEHLYAHEVPAALGEFQRVLKTDGFALIACPDLETVAALIVSDGVDSEAYRSSAGPITPLDMLFGHSASLAQGQLHMAHNTGFTCARAVARRVWVFDGACQARAIRPVGAGVDGERPQGSHSTTTAELRPRHV